MTAQRSLFTEIVIGNEDEPHLPTAKRSRYVPILRCRTIRENKQAVEAAIIRSPSDVARIAQDYLYGADREHAVCLMCDARNRLIAIHTISMGSLTESILHPRETFRAAIIASAAAIFLVHNHPSGDPTPSPEDVATTRRLKQAGDLLGIQLLDHVIIGDQKYISLKERGLL